MQMFRLFSYEFRKKENVHKLSTEYANDQVLWSNFPIITDWIED